MRGGRRFARLTAGGDKILRHRFGLLFAPSTLRRETGVMLAANRARPRFVRQSSRERGPGQEASDDLIRAVLTGGAHPIAAEAVRLDRITLHPGIGSRPDRVLALIWINPLSIRPSFAAMRDQVVDLGVVQEVFGSLALAAGAYRLLRDTVARNTRPLQFRQ
jgi:hypothetical protein